MIAPGRLAIYARVSTPEQQIDGQLARLRQWAAERGLAVALEESDVASGRLVRRPGQERILAEARGRHVQVVAVVRVDRWARSLGHLASSLDELHRLRVGFVAVDQGLEIPGDRDDATAGLVLGVLGAVAQWEASIIAERTKDGLRAARARGVRLGRPPRKGMPARPSADPPVPAGA